MRPVKSKSDFYSQVGSFVHERKLPYRSLNRLNSFPGVPLYLPGGTQKGVPLINPAAFQLPPVDANGNFTRFGNAGNGILRAINIWQLDLAVMKETKLTERVGLQFGVQAFNVLNHVQYGDFGKLSIGALLNTDVNTGKYVPPPVPQPAGSFGQITSTVNGQGTNPGTGLPRQLQFMMRLKF
jgi:hypothetical protein